MGLPYSRQINAAFDQVTPLVAAGFKVLRTTRDISILLAVIQVLTIILLGFILFALVLLLYCVNPDLEVRLLFPLFLNGFFYLPAVTFFFYSVSHPFQFQFVSVIFSLSLSLSLSLYIYIYMYRCCARVMV